MFENTDKDWATFLETDLGVVGAGPFWLADLRFRTGARIDADELWFQYFYGLNVGLMSFYDEFANEDHGATTLGPTLGPEAGVQFGYGAAFFEVSAGLHYFVWPYGRVGLGWKYGSLSPLPSEKRPSNRPSVAIALGEIGLSLAVNGIGRGALIDRYQEEILGYSSPAGVARVGLEAELMYQLGPWGVGLQGEAGTNPALVVGPLGLDTGAPYPFADLSARFVVSASLGDFRLQPFAGLLNGPGTGNWQFNYSGPEAGLRVKWSRVFLEGSIVFTEGIYRAHLGQTCRWFRLGAGTQLWGL